jgi:hypothetical protein
LQIDSGPHAKLAAMRLRYLSIVLLVPLLAACFGGDDDVAPTATAPAGAVVPLQDGVDGALFIHSIGISAPIRLAPVAQGEPPPSPQPDDVVLYDFGAEQPNLGGMPGEGGNVVLAGHNVTLVGCDDDPPCNGAFRVLRRVPPGADVDLLWEGETYRYQVVSRCVIPTAEFDDSAYLRTPQEQLTLLTGAVQWDSDKGWSHVLVVIAKPAPQTSVEPCLEGSPY